MFVTDDKIEKLTFAPGIQLQRLAHGEAISAVHWNFADGAELPLHEHVQEQFGFIIKGAFQVTIGDETCLLQAGEAYYVPAHTPHKFVPVGPTEAIDVFTPVREVTTTYHGK